MASVSRFLTQKLRLKVNEAKSAVAQPEERKFLGFSISNDGSERRIAPNALDNFKMQVRAMTRRTRGISLPLLIEDLTQSHCAGDVVLIATVGLHALARRIERGGSAGLTPILDDLRILAESYDRVLAALPNAFRVPVSSGGHWRGVVMRSPDGRPQLTVRTFLGPAAQ